MALAAFSGFSSYPGVRAAVAFAEETGILTGVNRPCDITLGEMSLIFANADRVFSSAEEI